MVPVVDMFAQDNQLRSPHRLRFVKSFRQSVCGWATGTRFGCEELQQDRHARLAFGGSFGRKRD
jgi:hypothetical protein